MMIGSGMQLVGLGVQLLPPHTELSRAVLIWSAKDMWGETYWWWLEVRHNAGLDVKLELWNGGFEENQINFYKEQYQSAVVSSWHAARSTLLEWADSRLFLPIDVLDHAIRGVFENTSKRDEKVVDSVVQTNFQ